MKSCQSTIIKMQRALNTIYSQNEENKENCRSILQNTKQFYSKDKEIVVTMYSIEESYLDVDTQKTRNKKLFSSTSQLQIILFLRDLLYLSRNEPLPTDNEMWNEKRKEIDYFKEQGVV